MDGRSPFFHSKPPGLVIFMVLRTWDAYSLHGSPRCRAEYGGPPSVTHHKITAASRQSLQKQLRLSMD